MANGGWESFLSYEDPEKDILIGLLRLRKCSADGTFRPELTQDGQSSLVRELHGASCSGPPKSICLIPASPVYGTAVPMHNRDPKKVSDCLYLASIACADPLTGSTHSSNIKVSALYSWRKQSASLGMSMVAKNWPSSQASACDHTMLVSATSELVFPFCRREVLTRIAFF